MPDETAKELLNRLIRQHPNATEDELRALWKKEIMADPKMMIRESGEMLHDEFEQTYGRQPVDFAEFWAFCKRRLMPN